MIILDTDALSLASEAKSRSDQRIAQWLEANDEAIHLSEATLLEIETGISKLLHLGRNKKADALRGWFNETVNKFETRLLPADRQTMLLAGQLRGKCQALGVEPGIGDSIIAATSVRFGAPIATFNARHFEPLGASWFKPPSDRDSS